MSLRGPCLLIVLSLWTLMHATGCGLSCEERYEEASTYVLRVVESNQRCNYDSDCVIIDVSTECGNLCPQPVAGDRTGAVADAIAFVNEQYCNDAGAQGCPYVTPSCTGSSRATCDLSAGGVCRFATDEAEATESPTP